MKFYPHTSSLRIIFVFCLLAGMGLAYLFWQQSNVLTLLSSVTMFGIALFFFVPVIKNQTVEFIDEDLVISSFGRIVTLDVNNLYQVIKRRDGTISYRFEKDDFICQVTPSAYHEGEILQEQFNKKFKLEELKVEVIKEA
jgi:hypothetical protein